MNPGALAPQLVLRCTRGLGGIGAARLIAEHGSAEGAVQSLRALEREQAEARAYWVVERCREEELTALYFGEAAAGPMAEAMLQLEINLEAPLAENEGILRYLELVDAGGAAMPEHMKKGDYRWLLHKQKALLDRYVQLRLRRELDQEARVRDGLRAALAADTLPAAIANAVAVAGEPAETEEMVALREEAGRLGDRSNEIFGVREIGYSKIGQQMRDIEGLRAVLDRAATAAPGEQRALVDEAVAITEKPATRGRIFW